MSDSPYSTMSCMTKYSASCGSHYPDRNSDQCYSVHIDHPDFLAFDIHCRLRPLRALSLRAMHRCSKIDWYGSGFPGCCRIANQLVAAENISILNLEQCS
jgi:hypothetical protein